ncbi:EF-hand domain-containing protein [Magnetospirillum sp. UT-4]|uniref:EF-hand domain-containing protein n=1 Tax=Magnetospirillum sp. UT-4 TaxID=2681467 RepID=UPI0013805B48|nr:EF-hand domain-containing protein [Magnetospirillum sp. UT-4]CAA7613371.1 conserved exported hypothetical protein [Magnetospirillum sp. UT-4]
MRFAFPLAAALVLAAANTAGAQTLPPDRGPAYVADQPPRQSPAMGLRSMDKDGDGAVNRQEFLAAHQGADDRFARMDIDKDGSVTREEFLAGAQQRRGAYFDAMDANKDGTITRAELDAKRTAMFDAMDADKDGRITADEMRRQGGRQMPQQSQRPE